MTRFCSARKRFGQHFLHENFIVEAIIQAIAPKETDTIIEIGPGLGALTQRLLPCLRQLSVIELDKKLIPLLEKRCQGLGRLIIYQADILKFDLKIISRLGSSLYRLVGNLPYNISTPLLFHCLTYAHLIQDMHFMLQKEVVNRIVAKPGEPSYGRLSVMLQYYCRVKKLFNVKPGAFQPPPRVDSAVLRLQPYPILPIKVDNVVLFSRVVKEAFSHPRKMLQNNLKNFCNKEKLEWLNIDPTQRPEQLSVTDYVNLTNLLSKDRIDKERE